jgi:Tol biopolymer transport system component
MTARRQQPVAREALIVWALFLFVGVEIFATYSRLPVRDLYHVSADGPLAGLGRFVVHLNFPTALIALPILTLVAGPLWPLALVSAALCCVIFWPGVVDQADLDAKWVNALPAVGVVLAIGLTLWAARGGIARGVRRRGDRWRVAVVVVLGVVAIPWICAELGWSFGHQNSWWAPVGQARLHPAVHHGHHHGMDGTLLVVSALLLSRALGEVVPDRLRRAVATYLGILVTYGLGNILNDAWYEQVVKRGWTSFSMPSVILPAANVPWALIVAIGALIGVAFSRIEGPGVVARRRVPHAFGLVPAAAAIALVVVGAVQHRQHTAGTPFATSGSGTIVFPMTKGGLFQLYEIGADGRGLRRLPDDDNADVAPSWSRQGLLAFQSNRDDAGDVFVSDEGFTAVERITGSGTEGEPAWAPNGERIAFVRGGDLYLAYAHGGGAFKLADDAAWPSFDPKTSLLAYESTRGSVHHVETLASDGDVERIRTGTDSRRPAWSPQAPLLAYECRVRTHWHICLFSERLGSHWAVTSGDFDDFAPAWSPDGTRIAFVSDRDGNDQLYVMQAQGSGVVRLTSGQADKDAPAWRP